jgi:hypothetical protein
MPPATIDDAVGHECTLNCQPSDVSWPDGLVYCGVSDMSVHGVQSHSHALSCVAHQLVPAAR